MPLTDEQVKRDEELKNLEARKNNGEQLSQEEEDTLRKGQQAPEDKSTERTNKGADANQGQRNPQGNFSPNKGSR